MKKGLSLNSHLGHNSDVGAKEYETIPGASMGSKMIRVKMPIGLFLLAQFVLIESKFSQTVNFFFFNSDLIKQRREDTGLESVLEIRASMMDISKTSSKKLSALFRRISSLDRLIENRKQLGICMIAVKKSWL